MDRFKFKERYKYSGLADYFTDQYVKECPKEPSGKQMLPPDQNTFDYVYEAGADTLCSLSQGVEIGSLAALLSKHPELELSFQAQLTSGDDDYADLNLTSFTRGIGVYIPLGVQIERPLRILRRVQESSRFLMERSAIFVGDSANAQLWVETEGPAQGLSLENNVCHVLLGTQARLEFLETFQMDSDSVYVHHNYVDQQAGSVMSHHILSLGGKAIRHNHNVRMLGTFAKHESRGLCFSEGSTHSDVDIRMEHTSPDCSSNQCYKQILDGEAMGVFSSRILIPKGSQRTLAYQKSNNIQLDRRTRMRTRPQLEIYADDVKCSHGATVGQLDSEALFYLRSRGIGENEARRLLLGAFASEVFSNIENESLFEALKDYAFQKIPFLYGL